MRFLTGISFIEELAFYPFLETFINDTIDLDGIIQKGFDALNGLDVVTQLLALIVMAVIFVMGAFELIKKLSKLIIVVGILVGLYLLYQNGVLDSLINAG